MDIVYNILLVLHLIGWAIVLGGWLATIKEPGVYKGTLHGALTALVTGVAMMGIWSAGLLDRSWEPNNIKLGVKLLIALGIVVMAIIAKRKGDQAGKGLKNAIGGATIVNICLAVLWH